MKTSFVIVITLLIIAVLVPTIVFRTYHHDVGYRIFASNPTAAAPSTTGLRHVR